MASPRTGPQSAVSKTDVEYVEELKAEQAEQQKVLQRVVDWAAYTESKLLSPQEKGLLLDYDKHTADEQSDLIDERGEQYAALFVKIVRSVHDKETVQYVLTLVEQMLEADRSRAVYFHRLTEAKEDPYSPFLQTLMHSGDAYTITKASHVLAMMFGCGMNPANPPVALESYMKWLSQHITTIPAAKRAAPLTALKDLLKDSNNQIIFAKLGGLKCLNMQFTAQEQNTQLLYLAGFCVWLLTFQADAFVLSELKKFEVVRRLVEIVKLSIREKHIRIAFSALRNLLKHEGESFMEDMIGHGLPKIVPTLQARKWKDPDVVKDMNVVVETLQKKIEQLSSFEMYLTELQSGNLQWSPVHSELFWGEHKNKFEEKNFELIRKLCELIDSPSDLTCEVACYDIGEFARFHPEGRRVVTRLGGKLRLMKHMNSRNPKISKQALLAVQKIMVQNWEFLTKKA